MVLNDRVKQLCVQDWQGSELGQIRQTVIPKEVFHLTLVDEQVVVFQWHLVKNLNLALN